jgi:hypothetical protein
MSQADDVWYVRFPDGQVMRAHNTEAVRRHLVSGRIPRASLVRRSPEDEWTALEWVPEFASLLDPDPSRLGSEPMLTESQAVALRERPAAAPPPPSPAPGKPRRALPRDDAMQLQTAGAHGMIEALLNALDSTLIRMKLGMACLAGLLSVVALLLAGHFGSGWDRPWAAWALAGLGLLVIGAACTVLLTQWTFVELSQARPAHWADGVTGLLRNTCRLVLADLVVIGLPVVILWLLPFVPGWLGPVEWFDGAEDVVAGAVLVMCLILWVLLGPLFGFALLLGPILIVEECSAGMALRLWRQFVRQHFSRLFFYEALAASLAALLTGPLLLPAGLAPLAVAASPVPALGPVNEVLKVTLSLLAGVALTPLIAYLIVANVFIYLNLRYQVGPGR